MDASIINNLITSGVTVGVGLITAAAAYVGTIKGSNMQIRSQQEAMHTQIAEERSRFKDEIIQQNEFARKAIENFISIEIKANFKLLNKDNFLRQNIYFDKIPSTYTVTETFKYDEYNRLKYDLIKSDGIMEIREIMRIYDMFYAVERTQSFSDFTDKEYSEFKEVYGICLEKYDSWEPVNSNY